MDPVSAAVLLAVGGLSGLAAGLFGIGGGVIIVPAAVFLLGTPFHEAKAAALLVITAVTALGIAEHRKERHVDLRVGLALGAGGVSGSLLAVWLAERMPAGQLEGLFGAVLLAAAARLWVEVRPLEDLPSWVWWLSPAVGFGAGLLAGLFGIGGGVLMVPAMVLLGVRVHTAVGTSLVAVLVNSAAGTVAHVGLGYGPAMAVLGLPLALGAALGIVAGARVASRTGAARLRRAFGVFLAVVGAAMVVKSLGWWGP